MMSDVCEHGVSFEDFCDDCAHHPVDVWVGFPEIMCGFCQTRWPCESQLAIDSRLYGEATVPEQDLDE